MATAPAEKKPNPNASKPKQNLLLIGGVMVALAGMWFLYEANPGGFLRQPTEQEKKDEKEAAEDAKRHADEAAREAARHK